MRGEQLSMSGLGARPPGGKHRMAKFESSQHMLLRDAAAVIERQAQRRPRGQMLQQAQVVSHRRRGRRIGAEPIVPARPRAPRPGQQRDIGVQHGLVALVGKRRQHFPLADRGVFAQDS